MSIPPLVCSTPPPPDQCEDDKDPDDFDLQYNLSQEDEDEHYDYGNFSNYNHFQASESKNKKPDIILADESEIVEKKNILTEEESNHTETEGRANTTTDCKLKLDEDVNIEDLNLKVDQENVEKPDVTSNINISHEGETNNHDVDIEKVDVNVVVQDIQSDVHVVEQDDFSSEYIIESASIDNIDDPPKYVNEIIEDELNDLQVDISQQNIVFENVPQFDSSKQIIKESEDLSNLNNVLDDDFGEFEDFQFVSSNNKSTNILANYDNPWDNKESDNLNIGDFKADFNENDSVLLHKPVSSGLFDKETENQIKVDEPKDDDFGDFDDFKSSVNETEGNVIRDDSLSCQQVPVLNLQSPDNENQVIESINKVLSSIFEQEISEPDTQFESKLESLLSETWGHLLETDVRQPYIVNWNNSLGQKTLLKALCIDSRNILFGPKWNYNMPKYAANLSVAPLQPQKQSTPLNAVQSDNPNIDKSGTKAASTWSDPFSSDGQEFTYAEALLLDLEHLMATLDQMAHNHSTLKISELLSHACNTDNGSENTVIATGPTDLDVFEAAVSTKTDKIYSSTLNVQPLRQINLPDTHIFTPTDSETPRSKTIHYDDSPSVLLPQTLIEDKKDKHMADNLTPQPSSSSVSNLENDNEYWEFQDFKGKSQVLPQSQQILENSESKINHIVPNPNITYGTQVLQPIKVEPIMPSLNWPDPGEVKDTFEDFSDFVSNSSWGKEKQDLSPNVAGTQVEESVKSDIIVKAENTTIDRETSNISDSFDDEFDTFKSALPHKSAPERNLNNLTNHVPPQTSHEMTDFDAVFPKSDNINSDNISFTNTARSKDNLVQNPMSFVSYNLDEDANHKTDLTIKNSSTQSGSMQSASIQLNPNILQPIVNTSISTNHNQQKSAQILQPLSLESYSQINWPNPGIDLQDLSRFNPVETLQSLKSDLSTNSHSKVASPVHNQKNTTNNQVMDEDIWGDFVSSKPKQQQVLPKKPTTFVDDDEWTDFVSSPSVKPQNGLNTISLNVHTNLNIQKSSSQIKFPLKNIATKHSDIPTLNYITPKSSSHKSYNDRHFQNL